MYNHSLALNYSWKYMINAGIGYDYVRDSYTHIESTDPVTGVRITKPENIGKAHYLNLNLSANYTFRKWWTMIYYMGGRIGQEKLNYRERTVVKNVYDIWFYFSESFTFLKNYSFEISGNILPAMQETFGRSQGRFFLSAGFKANLLKNALTLRLTVNDILNNGFWKEDYTFPDGSRTKGDYFWESRGVWINISYRFGKQNIQTRKTSTDSEELQRIGGGGGSGGKM